MRKENSTNKINEDRLKEICGSAHALSIIGGRWKTTILHLLMQKKMRYTELRNLIENVSDRVLVLHLKELEKDRLIKKHIFPEVPPRVEYELTEEGYAIKKMLMAVSEWGTKHRGDADLNPKFNPFKKKEHL